MLFASFHFHIFGLPVTSDAVVVLEVRQYAPGDALGRRYHLLESPVVAGGAVSVPGDDTAQQDDLNCPSVKVSEGLRGQAKFLRPPEDTLVFKIIVITTRYLMI